MDHGSHAGGGNSTCVVSMLWNWNTIDACFLAEGWQIQNNGMFAASCIGVALLATLLEALRRLARDYDASLHKSLLVAYGPADPACIAPTKARLPFLGRRPRITALQQIVRTVLHVAIFGIAYLLMLLAMYYNGYIIISILLGTGLGKFLCDWMELGDVAGGKDDPTVCCG